MAFQRGRSATVLWLVGQGLIWLGRLLLTAALLYGLHVLFEVLYLTPYLYLYLKGH